MIALQDAEPEMVSSKEAGRLVGRAPGYLTRLAQEGKIRSRRIPKTRYPGYEVRVCLEDVRALFPADGPGSDEIAAGDAAHLLGVQRTTILRYITEGRIAAREIPGTRWGHRYILKRADVDKLTSQRRPNPGEVMLEDAALIAGVTQGTIWKAIRDGHLPSRELIHGRAVPIANVLSLWPMRERGLITQAQAARLLNLTRQRVDQMLSEGALDEWRTPHGKRYVLVDSVSRCLDQGDAHHASQS